VALQKELEKLTGEWEQALEEENYELAEGLDAQIAALKLKVK
jgi:protein-arginine kinase activator protein McsA